MTTYETELDDSPIISKDGIQGRKPTPGLERIYAENKVAGDKHATNCARWQAMKNEWPRLLREAARRDDGVQGSNTFTGTFTTNFLITGVTVKLYNRFAAARLFTRDNRTDPTKPLAAGIMKFNQTTTDGTKVGKAVTNFETLAGSTNGNDDSDVEPITITPFQYTAGGHVTNAELNSGLRVGDILEAKAVDLADEISQVLTTPITAANFPTAGVTSAPAAFGFSDLATLQGLLKKANERNLLLDGEYIARIANQPGFFQRTGTVGGELNAWAAYGWDNIARHTQWGAAGANVRGFACAPTAIGIITGLPLNPPEGIPGNIVQMGTALLPDVQIAIGTYAWFSAQTRTFYFSYDLVAGATLLDGTAGYLVTSS